MSDPTNWTERRQFGRRPLNIDAVAQLPGAVEIPCVVENLSEGGALLFFPTKVAPISDFDLVVEDVPFRLQCEMRYQVGIRFGVRFRHVSQGEALVRHFFSSATTAKVPTNNTARNIPDRAPPPSRSIRQLREALLPLIAPDAVHPGAAASAAATLPAERDEAGPAPLACTAAEPQRAAPSNSRPSQVSTRPARLIAKR